MSGTHIWYGENGTPYEYRVYGLDSRWNDVPGNYIFAKMLSGVWYPLYIGETGSFKERLVESHEKWEEAIRHGMTHIHAHSGGQVYDTRRYEEWNLIRKHNPPLNLKS